MPTIVAFLAALALSAAARAAGIEGRWTTFDDDTGKPRSTVEIEARNGLYTGRIVSLMLEPGEPADPRCTACTGERANAPIVGLAVLSVARRAGEHEDYAGTAFDPEEGRTYRCIVTPAPDGSTLTIRGYVGLPLFGRSVTWRRAR